MRTVAATLCVAVCAQAVSGVSLRQRVSPRHVAQHSDDDEPLRSTGAVEGLKDINWALQDVANRNVETVKFPEVADGLVACNAKDAQSINLLQGKPQPKGKGDEWVPYDGFFYMSCTDDQSPKNIQLKYRENTDKEKREEMTSDVCFEFCRSKAGMRFFALGAGRDCYCAPYVTVAGGNGMCTKPCDGDKSQICGGEPMVSVFEMHRCSDTMEVAEKALGQCKQLEHHAKELGSNATLVLQGMDSSADAMKVTEVRHDIQEAAILLNKITRDVVLKVEAATAAQKALEKALAGGVNTLSQIRAVEDATRTMLRKCQGESPARPGEMKVSARATHAYLYEHDMSGALGSLGLSAEELHKQALNDPPHIVHRMPDYLRKKAHCDDAPHNGCDTFDVMYYPQGTWIQTFNGFLNLKTSPRKVNAKVWVHEFLLQCVNLCQLTSKCVAADIFGRAEDGEDAYSATCVIKSDVHTVYVSKMKGKFAYSIDTGFMMEDYFQLHKKQINWILEV